jgi:hypothetical protein
MPHLELNCECTAQLASCNKPLGAASASAVLSTLLPMFAASHSMFLMWKYAGRLNDISCWSVEPASTAVTAAL